MDKKTIDNIVWYIPFKKLRNSLRDYLTELISIQNNQYNSIKTLEAIILSKLEYYNKEELNSIKNLDNFIKRGMHNQFTIRLAKSVIDSVNYLEQKNSNDIKLFQSTMQELEYILINEIEIDGLFLEFGVFNGKSINIMSNILKNKVFYGFDSFEGLPEYWIPGFDKGKFNLEGNLPKVNKNVSLIKGWFNETLPDFCKDHKENIAFLHIDCDLYSSTKTIFDNLKDRIKPGTIITFDEYFGYYNWKNHEFKAFQEFVNENNIKYKYLSSNSYTSCSVKITEADQTMK